MKRSRRSLSGIVLMIQASVAFSLMALCVKWASVNLPSLEIVFFRSLIGTAMVLGVMFHKKIPLLGRHRKSMFIRGLSGFLALTLHFYTIAHLPLGTAVMLNYTAPIFVAILAMIFLNERLSLLLGSMILISFSGVYLLVQGEFFGWNRYVVLGILSAIFAAVASIFIRIVKYKESPLTIIFYFTGLSTIGSLFYLPFGFRWPGLMDWLALAGVGIGSFYGQLWMTIALRRAPASLIGPFAYITPLLSFAYGLIFWNETLTLTSLAGAFLIVLGGSLITHFETRKT
jgi:drug/metabolite transporter (DMT)-like permease